MLKPSPSSAADRRAHTVRNLRTLIVLCAACAAYVMVAFAVVAVPGF